VDLCPDLTNWYDNISSKNIEGVYNEYRTDETRINDGGST
jgi:hypothetical protein